jgi:two-component system sensor histidine kinase KdpD
VTLFFASVPELPELRVAHGVLVYLLLIVGASREADLWLSAAMLLASYLAVDWFFVPPRRALGVPSEMDFIILIGFVITAAVISRLVFSLRRTADVATARAEEIERLSAERLQLEMHASRADVLREAERLKDALIASITHDMRSPLSTLSMLSDRESRLPSDVALARIAEETRRLADYLVAMRKFAFTEERAISPIVVESHVVDDLISTALKSRERVLLGRAITMQLPDEPALVLVRCDFTLALQILANLLENAARYAPPNSPIDVIVSTSVDGVEIAVADRGPGLTAQDLRSVFEPLRRGAASGGPAEGFGMGLAIARTFAHAQRGDIRYRSRVGGGAEFVLVLPAAPAPPLFDAPLAEPLAASLAPPSKQAVSA